MKTLALELSTARGSIAWLDEVAEPSEAGQLLGAKRVDPVMCEWPNDRKNSGAFFEHLASIRQKFGLPDTIIVGLGPGSYAGTRIAISTAIGLQASGASGGTGSVPSARSAGRQRGRPPTSSRIRLIGYPSICAMECEADEYGVIGDARRKSFFFARVRANDLIEGPDLFDETELKNKLDKLEDTLATFTSESLPQFERAEIGYPSASLLARLALNTRHSFSFPPLEPIYLREPHITIPRTAATAS